MQLVAQRVTLLPDWLRSCSAVTRQEKRTLDKPHGTTRVANHENPDHFLDTKQVVFSSYSGLTGA